MEINFPVFGWTGWSQVLGVTPSRIFEWLNDENIPSQYCLNMILSNFALTDNCPEKHLWDEMAKRRATNVSPHGARMLPTVETYTKRPVFDPVRSALAKMSEIDQEKYLLELYPEMP